MKLLLYCTKAKPYLYKTEKPMIEKKFVDYHTQLNKAVLTENLNGKIVAECDFEVEEIGTYSKEDIIYLGIKQVQYDVELLEQSCLSNQQMNDYLKLGGGYAIHIKNLHIFDKPKELSEYSKRIGKDFQVLGKAPQNMMKCCEIKYMVKDYILISIRPQWLCKILNGEKTIEVRKKVLKEKLK